MSSEKISLSEAIERIAQGLRESGGHRTERWMSNGTIKLSQKREGGPRIKTLAVIEKEPSMAYQEVWQEGSGAWPFKVGEYQSTIHLFNPGVPANPLSHPIEMEFCDCLNYSRIGLNQDGERVHFGGVVDIERSIDGREVLRVAGGKFVFVPSLEEIIQRMASNEPFFDPVDASEIKIR